MTSHVIPLFLLEIRYQGFVLQMNVNKRIDTKHPAFSPVVSSDKGFSFLFTENKMATTRRYKMVPIVDKFSGTTNWREKPKDVSCGRVNMTAKS